MFVCDKFKDDEERCCVVSKVKCLLVECFVM